MTCNEVRSRLGEWLDDELPTELRTLMRQHLDRCPDCHREHQALQSMTAAIATPPEAEAPPDLWNTIEQRLDITVPRNRFLRLGRRPLAAAAVILLALGFGWFTLDTPWESRALAARIDFRPLLEQADGDVHAGIRALMAEYGGEPLTAKQAAERVKLRIHAPDVLPGGLRLESNYLLNMGNHHWSLAFHFVGPAGHLLLLQCPPNVEKNYGNYECLPCSLGAHEGHSVRVGKLYLSHTASENVCVCVVTTLDEHNALPAAMEAIRIDR